MSLIGKTVIELEGLAPTVFAGKILRELGAEVILVSEPKEKDLEFPIQGNSLFPFL